MYIKEITVGISETINVGNFNTIRPSVSLTAVLEDGEELGAINKELFEVAREHYLVNLIKITQAREKRDHYRNAIEWAVDELKVMIKASEEAEAREGHKRRLKLNRSGQ